METTGSGIFGRLSEKVLSWIALAVIVLLGVAIYQMPHDTKAAIWSGFWRAVVWIVVAAALPWSAALIIRRIAEAGTNWAGVALIGFYFALDLAAAAVLMTGWPAGGWAWAASLGALALAATYNYLVTEYLADTTG